jgi:hypothetical protein
LTLVTTTNIASATISNQHQSTSAGHASAVQTALESLRFPDGQHDRQQASDQLCESSDVAHSTPAHRSRPVWRDCERPHRPTSATPCSPLRLDSSPPPALLVAHRQWMKPTFKVNSCVRLGAREKRTKKMSFSIVAICTSLCLASTGNGAC